MSKLNDLLAGRFKSSKKEKMNELVARSASGNLSSFGSVFQLSPISEQEKKDLQQLLEKYRSDNTNLDEDLQLLTTITSEVKAISSQAIILHGERIKKAQTLLKKYHDGAFTSWLTSTYGNRQTPYNFLQYYELYHSLPQKLQSIINEMPRQAIYSLSSRSAPLDQKESFIKEYSGETKTELLEKLRNNFPLAKQDKRNANKAKTTLELLAKTLKMTQDDLFNPTFEEKKEIEKILSAIQTQLGT